MKRNNPVRIVEKETEKKCESINGSDQEMFKLLFIVKYSRFEKHNKKQSALESAYA